MARLQEAVAALHAAAGLSSSRHLGLKGSKVLQAVVPDGARPSARKPPSF